MTSRVNFVGLFGAALVVVGCATTPTEPAVPEEGPCDAAAAQELVGETATQSLGTRAIQLTGARSLRWIPEGSAVTMDYISTRLNIEFDDNRAVTAIRCG